MADAAKGQKRATRGSNGGPPQRRFREFQFIVTPILLVEEDDQVPYPHAADQIVLRGVAELQAFIDRFPDELEQLNEQQEVNEKEKAKNG